MSLDLPAVPPPPTPRPKLNKPVTLVAGCGLGIGAVAVFVAAVFVVAAVILPGRAIPRSQMFVGDLYAKAEANKNLSKDELSEYSEIAKLVAAPESSVFVVNVGGAILFDHLKDGALSEEEIAEAHSVREDLAKTPTGGVLVLMTYVSAHPEMQKKMNAFARDMALSAAAQR